MPGVTVEAWRERGLLPMPPRSDVWTLVIQLPPPNALRKMWTTDTPTHTVVTPAPTPKMQVEVMRLAEPAPPPTPLGRNLKNLWILYWNHGGITGNTNLRLTNYISYRPDEVSLRVIAYRGTAVLVRKDVMHETIEQTNYASTSLLGVRVGLVEAECELMRAGHPHHFQRPNPPAPSRRS
ncbi:hypothetical protein EVAR_9277_1 [Eumeta japonica]|uniref:Uncharacterized protein n=1 Tax=Eumeta variegata TaxID=151549 RepID=A0A4C1TNS9_EUMVA|nr:hypothetical protein EVAR_9277_1 [Eumeta japonica]